VGDSTVIPDRARRRPGVDDPQPGGRHDGDALGLGVVVGHLRQRADDALADEPPQPLDPGVGGLVPAHARPVALVAQPVLRVLLDGADGEALLVGGPVGAVVLGLEEESRTSSDFTSFQAASPAARMAICPSRLTWPNSTSSTLSAFQALGMPTRRPS
jgi:hypothetical protein